jgi:hypothetical protein
LLEHVADNGANGGNRVCSERREWLCHGCHYKWYDSSGFMLILESYNAVQRTWGPVCQHAL